MPLEMRRLEGEEIRLRVLLQGEHRLQFLLAKDENLVTVVSQKSLDLSTGRSESGRHRRSDLEEDRGGIQRRKKPTASPEHMEFGPFHVHLQKVDFPQGCLGAEPV